MVLGILDAVDLTSEQAVDGDAQVMIFRFNGVCYKAAEDPQDGYRSCLDRIVVLPMGFHMANVFTPCTVYVEVAPSSSTDTTRMYDSTTKLLVLEVGTENTDDYYPYFVANFNPQNMLSNKGR